MKYSRLLRAGISASMALLIIVAMLFTFSVQANAQDGGDDPTPTAVPDGDEGATIVDEIPAFYQGDAVITGDAEWTLDNLVYESRYPDGFFFSTEVSSTGGNIVNVSVVYSHTPGQRGRGQGVYDPDTGIATVEAEPTRDAPAWLALNYQWLFEDEEGNLYESEWIVGNEYYDPEGEWTRVESEDVIVFVEDGLPDDTAELVVQAMEDQRETYRQAFGGLYPYKVRIILYSNFTSWRSWYPSSQRGNSNVVGTTDDNWGAVVQVVTSGGISELAYGTVLHEVAHLYQGEFANQLFPGGSWITEGNATFFELLQDSDYEQRVRNVAEQGDLKAFLIGPGPGSNGPDGRFRWDYEAGYAFWKWFIETYGLEGHRQIIELGSRNTPLRAGLVEVTGLSLEELEQNFRDWIGAPGPAPTPFPTPEFRFPPTVTPFGQ